MSASPQRLPGRTTATPKPKLVLRPRGIHHGHHRAEIVTRYERSAWAGRALSLHLHRVTSGCAEAAWILFVYQHTVGSADPKERAMKHSPPLLPEDCAKESGLGAQVIRDARRKCVAKGFTPRISSNKADGKDFYRFRVDFDKMAAAPNAAQSQEGAFVPRKPVQSERQGEEKAKSVDFTTTYAESRAPVGAPDSLILPAGTVAVAPKLAHSAKQVEVSHSFPYDVAVSSTIASSGNLRVHISPPPGSGEPPARQSSAALNSNGTDRTPGGPALINPSTARAADSLTDEAFCHRLVDLNVPALDDAMLARIRRDMRCADEFFLVRVALKAKTKPVTLVRLPFILNDANEAWKNGGQRKWEEMQEMERLQAEQEVRNRSEWAARAAQYEAGAEPLPPAPKAPTRAELLASARKELATAKRDHKNAQDDAAQDDAVKRLRAAEAEITRLEDSARRK